MAGEWYTGRKGDWEGGGEVKGGYWKVKGGLL